MNYQFSLGSIASGVCPGCRKGKVYSGIVSMHPKCPQCGYNFFPESGFYLGAMMVAYAVTAFLMIPFIIFLKIAEVDDSVMMLAPIVLYLFVGFFVVRYSRLIWLHLAHSMSKLDQDQK